MIWHYRLYLNGKAISAAVYTTNMKRSLYLIRRLRRNYISRAKSQCLTPVQRGSRTSFTRQRGLRASFDCHRFSHRFCRDAGVEKAELAACGVLHSCLGGQDAALRPCGDEADMELGRRARDALTPGVPAALPRRHCPADCGGVSPHNSLSAFFRNSSYSLTVRRRQ